MEFRGPALSEADVAAFEHQIGDRLPDDYRRFLMEVNGGRIDVNTWFDDGIVNMLFSLHDANEDNDLLISYLDAGKYSPLPSRDLLYIGYDDGGGRLLLGIAGEHRGEVWFEDRENPRPEGSNPRVLWHDRRDMRKLADSFEEFMASLKPPTAGGAQ